MSYREGIPEVFVGLGESWPEGDQDRHISLIGALIRRRVNRWIAPELCYRSGSVSQKGYAANAAGILCNTFAVGYSCHITRINIELNR